MLGLDWQTVWRTIACEHFMPGHNIIVQHCKGQPSYVWSITQKTVEMFIIFMDKSVEILSLQE